MAQSVGEVALDIVAGENTVGDAINDAMNDAELLYSLAITGGTLLKHFIVFKFVQFRYLQVVLYQLLVC